MIKKITRIILAQYGPQTRYIYATYTICKQQLGDVNNMIKSLKD
jgi:hypothetical protein